MRVQMCIEGGQFKKLLRIEWNDQIYKEKTRSTLHPYGYGVRGSIKKNFPLQIVWNVKKLNKKFSNSISMQQGEGLRDQFMKNIHHRN